MNSKDILNWIEVNASDLRATEVNRDETHVEIYLGWVTNWFSEWKGTYIDFVLSDEGHLVFSINKKQGEYTYETMFPFHSEFTYREGHPMAGQAGSCYCQSKEASEAKKLNESGKWLSFDWVNHTEATEQTLENLFAYLWCEIT